MYIDSHAHFDLCLENSDFSEETLINGLKDNKIAHSVHISIDVSGFQWSLDFAKRFKDQGFLFTLGIHPSSKADRHNLNYLSDFVEKIMKSENADLLFGVGETGLDYYRMRQPKEMQIKSFEYQIELAIKWNLPLIVHSRDSIHDTLRILGKNTPQKGIMHCFSGDSKIAKNVLDMGFYISFAGNLTYKNASPLHDAAVYIPMDRLLLETDAPFLTPVPLRGRKNRPEYVIHTYRFIAGLKKVNPSTLEEHIMNNFNSLIKY